VFLGGIGESVKCLFFAIIYTIGLTIMRDFTEQSINRSRTNAQRVCKDRCVLLVYAPTEDPDSGETVYSYTPHATEFECIYEPGANGERAGITPVLQSDAKVLLPMQYQGLVSARDRIRIVARKGTRLTVPDEYDVQGAPQTGNLFVIVMLQNISADGGA
jgi:hypothetical protein